MSYIAYCRVSTTDQDPTMQVEAIKKKYPTASIYEEKASASSRDDRPVLGLILQSLRQGDKLVVWKLDRLARNTLDLLQLKNEITAKGAALVVLDLDIDTSTASGECFLQMLAVFAEFETNLRKERQLAGIAVAKTQGKYKGRPESFDKDEIKDLLAAGESHAAIARKLGCSAKTVQRVKQAMVPKSSDMTREEAARLARNPMDH
ncbi:MAG: recombinase family protein [Proteobacteria bacterium]|nr:recombinase family protein [Pseudomonadota bacterium]